MILVDINEQVHSASPATQLQNLHISIPSSSAVCEEEFYDLEVVNGLLLGPSCGVFLVSALASLPTDKRRHAISSLKAWAGYMRPKDPKALAARLRHTLESLVRVDLSPTHCPLHRSSPGHAILSSLPFAARALAEFYLPPRLLVCPTRGLALLRQARQCSTLHQLEQMLADVKRGINQGFASHYSARPQGEVAAVDWVVRLVLDRSTDTGYRVEHVGPQRTLGTSTYMHRMLGADRFIRAQVKSRQQWWTAEGKAAVQRLAQQGISFACRRYRCVGHRDPCRSELYLMAEESMGREDHGFRPLQAHEALAGLVGDFAFFPSVSKMAARTALAFSHSHALVLRPEQVQLIDDVCSSSEDGTVLTDGSGFIAPDLLARIPTGLYQGRPRPITTSASREGGDRPSRPGAVVQVRLICAHGAFKGTLLVHPRLRGVVQLRRASMLKVPPSRLPRPAPTLDVLTRFQPLKSTTRLSRELLLLLMARGVPRTVFTRMLRQELDALEAARQSPSCLQDLLQRECGQARLPGSSEWQVVEMLRHGHSVSEPYIQRVLARLRSRVLGKLKQGRVRCRDSVYLVGQPDPLGVLEPGQVMVCHGLPRLCCSGGEGQVGGVVDSDGFLEGSVLVARHPVHDPASLQVFQAVCHPALKSYLGQHAGLLLFSTRGPCSPAQALSGGDYDGDTFWVCAQPEVVQHVHKTASMTTSNLTQTGTESVRLPLSLGPSPPPPSVSSLGGPASSGVQVVCEGGPFDLGTAALGPALTPSDMARGLDCFFAQARTAEVISRASEWWLVHADAHGPQHRACRELAAIISAALDSAKTGRLKALPPSLKPQAGVPSYLNRFSKSTRLVGSEAGREPSVLAECWSTITAVQAAEPMDDHSGSRATCLDPDLRAEGSSVLLQEADRWVKHYTQAFHARMALADQAAASSGTRGNEAAATHYWAMRRELAAEVRLRMEAVVRQRQGPHGASSAQWRLAAASALYEANYVQGSLLHLAWDVAMPELNRLKRDAAMGTRQQAMPVES